MYDAWMVGVWRACKCKINRVYWYEYALCQWVVIYVRIFLCLASPPALHIWLNNEWMDMDRQNKLCLSLANVCWHEKFQSLRPSVMQQANEKIEKASRMMKMYDAWFLWLISHMIKRFTFRVWKMLPVFTFLVLAIVIFLSLAGAEFFKRKTKVISCY